ncbi:DUF6221 family protein [Streptomyces sp. NPDC004324]
MDDLALWLGEQLDEDERIAQAASPGPWEQSGVGDLGWTVSGPWAEVPDSEQGRADADFIAKHDPARVLREVEAKRRIAELHKPYDLDARDRSGPMIGCTECVHDDTIYPCTTLRLLATVYQDRPGYQEGWAL